MGAPMSDTIGGGDPVLVRDALGTLWALDERAVDEPWRALLAMGPRYTRACLSDLEWAYGPVTVVGRVTGDPTMVTDSDGDLWVYDGRIPQRPWRFVCGSIGRYSLSEVEGEFGPVEVIGWKVDD